MRIVMDMSNYETELDPEQIEYGDDVLYAGWNPAVVLSQQQPLTPPGADISAALAPENVELFLQRMYACQR
ncbi:MAG: hypothetical protein HY306_00490 [Nitrosomonadales bacterium]|nr:hypothetical protein [Nitrosomonadales bacterium]